VTNLYVVQIDATHANATKIPASAIAVAGYVTGTSDIKWTTEDWARFPQASKLTIDQSPSLAVWSAGEAIIADVEPRAGTVMAAIAGAKQRAARGTDAPVYLSFDWLALARDAANFNGLAHRMRWWVADYNWSESEAIAFMEANSDVMAVQFASPSSNPATKVPGTNGAVTLAAAQCDLSIKRADWWIAPSVAATGWTE
jgi:hypothetical protein